MRDKERRSIRWGVRAKLGVFSMLLLLLPTLVVGYTNYQVAKEETDNLIRGDLANTVRLAIETIAVMDEAVKKGTLSLEDAQEQVKTLLLGPKEASGERPINQKIDLGENGYFFVLDDKGVLLAHPLLEGENIWDRQSSDGVLYIQDMIRRATREGGGFTTYFWPLPDSAEEAEKISYAELAPQWGWIVAAGSYMRDYNEGQRRILEVLSWTLGICLVAGIVATYLFSRHLVRPLAQMAERARRMADGDLTVSELQLRRSDEVGRLADDFNRMSAGLRDMLKRTETSTVRLKQASGELSVSSEENVRSVRHVAEAIEEVSRDMDTQSTGVEETGKAMEEMARGIQRVAETSAVALESSAHAVERSNDGQRLIEQAVGQMHAIGETVTHLSAVVGVLNERSQEIGDIIRVITDISNQTNLLALNAGIEAARAGEHGRGFAVVAQEVRKLAERSHEAAGRVAEMIETVQSNIGQASDAMERGGREVARGTTVVEETGRVFGEILLSVKQVLNQIQEASASSEQMSAGAQEITASIQEVSRIAEATSGRAQGIMAASEEQYAATEQIQAMVATLNAVVDELSAAAAKFKI